jgi:hypothetical protein
MAAYSRLLIGETIIPEEAGENKYVYMLDVVMMSFGGKERSRKGFLELQNC